MYSSSLQVCCVTAMTNNDKVVLFQPRRSSAYSETLILTTDETYVMWDTDTIVLWGKCFFFGICCTYTHSGQVQLTLYSHETFTHPSTNRDQCRATSFILFRKSCIVALVSSQPRASSSNFYCATACNATYGMSKAFLSVRPSVCPSVWQTRA